MALSRARRNLISRLTALVFGIVFLYAGWKCFAWGEKARTDPLLQSDAHRHNRSEARVLLAPYVIAIGIGGLGAMLVGVGVLPARVLHAVNPMYSTATPEDVCRAIVGEP